LAGEIVESRTIGHSCLRLYVELVAIIIVGQQSKPGVGIGSRYLGVERLKSDKQFVYGIRFVVELFKGDGIFVVLCGCLRYGLRYAKKQHY